MNTKFGVFVMTILITSLFLAGCRSQALSSSGSGSATNRNQVVPSGGSGGPNGAPPSGSMPSGAGGDRIMIAINDSGTTAKSTQTTTQTTSNTAPSQVSPMLLQAVIQMLRSISQVSG